jgi:signal transduction histidine kinase/CheY-like chemotaxis protein
MVSVLVSTLVFLGMFGNVAQILSPFVALATAFGTAPLIAWATGGRYYLARPDTGLPDVSEICCTICENTFERRDVALCPAYSGPICSLCCTLEARCRDVCKTDSRFTEQLATFLRKVLPGRVAATLNTRAGHFAGLLLFFNVIVVLLLSFIYHQYSGVAPAERAVISTTLWVVYLCLLVLSGVGAWLTVLAHESRRAAEQESARQTAMLMEEIEAHKRTDAALQRAKEVAEAANIAKTRYVVGMSHEIRTPLNSIFGYAQLLERGADIPAENAARVIRRSSEHLSNLVDGLLDISRIENGLLRLNRDKVRLLEFLDQLVDMFRLQAAAKGIAFRYHPPSNLPTCVHTDQKRLRQILINLLSNAIKYTENGHASLTIRYRSDVAEFEIADTGIGIPPEDLERVFEPFERGRAHAVRSLPGTGLGLTITKLLTQIMGGEILVRSKVGEGTTFTVRILLSQATPDVPRTARQHRARGYAGSRRTILLVDDDPAHVELLKNVLQPLDFILLPAHDGRSGLELAAQHTPHLALLDISLPDMTGWDLVRKLRASGGEKRPPRIAMVSANAHEYSPGGNDGPLHDAFLAKPIDIDMLLECVGSLLQLEWLYDAAPPSSSATDNSLDSPPTQCLRHIGALYELGRIGHVRGIEAKLREIEAEHPANGPFAARLRGFIANFDLKRYMTTLESMQKHG